MEDKTELWQLSAVGVQGMLSFLALARSVVVVRLLSPEDYGIIGIATAVGSSFTIFQNLGLGVGMAKEAALAKETGKLGLATATVLTVRVVMLLPLLAALVALGAPHAASLYNRPELHTLICLHALFILVSSPGDILGYVLTGSGRFRLFFLLRFFNEALLTTCVCVMIWKWKTAGYFIGHTAAGGIYAFVCLIVVWRVVGRIEKASWVELKALLKSVFRTSFSAYISKLARTFSSQIPVLAAGMCLPVGSVGILKFGMQAGSYAATILSAAHVVTLPRMTAFLQQHGPEYLAHRFARNFGLFSSFISCLFIGFVAVAPELIRLVGGERYIASSGSFQMMMVVYYFIVLADTIFSGIHLPTNREKLYILSCVAYFILSASASLASILIMRTPEAALVGLLIGSLIHYMIASMSTIGHPNLNFTMIRAGIKVLAVAVFALFMILFNLPGSRWLLGTIGILLLTAELAKSASGGRRKLSKCASILRMD